MIRKFRIKFLLSKNIDKEHAERFCAGVEVLLSYWYHTLCAEYGGGLNIYLVFQQEIIFVSEALGLEAKAPRGLEVHVIL